MAIRLPLGMCQMFEYHLCITHMHILLYCTLLYCGFCKLKFCGNSVLTDDSIF